MQQRTWRLLFVCPKCPFQHQAVVDNDKLAAAITDLTQNLGVTTVLIEDEALAEIKDIDATEEGVHAFIASEHPTILDAILNKGKQK